MPIEITQVKPEQPLVSVPPKPAAPPSSVIARKQPHPTVGMEGMNWFMRTQYPSPDLQQERELLPRNNAIRIADRSIHPVPKTHPLNGVYQNVARNIIPTFQWRETPGMDPHAIFWTRNIPGTIDAHANTPGYMKSRMAEVIANWQDKSLPKPRTMQMSIPAVKRLFQQNAPEISVAVYPTDTSVQDEKYATAFFPGRSGDRNDTGYIRMQELTPHARADVQPYGPRNDLYYIPNANSADIATSGFDRADAVLTPWGRFGADYIHELNHALSNQSRLQYLRLTPIAQIQKALEQYRKDRTGLFWNDEDLQKEAPIFHYSLDLAEQVGAQQSFQREHPAVQRLVQKNPDLFKTYDAAVLKELQSLPTTVRKPTDYYKLVDFYKKNSTLLWEGARYVDQLKQKENRIKALDRRIRENPKSPSVIEWKKQKRLLEEDLNENAIRSLYTAKNRKPAVNNPYSVYKTASNNNEVVSTMMTKAASSVYREKLAKNAPMTDAVVGNSQKRKQQSRSMNGFLKQKDKEQSDQTRAISKKAANPLMLLKAVGNVLRGVNPKLLPAAGSVITGGSLAAAGAKAYNNHMFRKGVQQAAEETAQQHLYGPDGRYAHIPGPTEIIIGGPNATGPIEGYIKERRQRGSAAAEKSALPMDSWQTVDSQMAQGNTGAALREVGNMLQKDPKKTLGKIKSGISAGVQMGAETYPKQLKEMAERIKEVAVGVATRAPRVFIDTPEGRAALAGIGGVGLGAGGVALYNWYRRKKEEEARKKRQVE